MNNRTLPPAFIDWLCEAFIATHFSSEQIRDLALQQLAQWRDGEPHTAMPGYDTPPPDAPGSQAPAGWTPYAFREIRDVADLRLRRSRELDPVTEPASVVHFV